MAQRQAPRRGGGGAPASAALVALALAGCGDNIAALDTDAAARVDAPVDAPDDGPVDAPGPGPALCVFDYDLTLSSHLCPATAGLPAYHCRTTTCATYGWHDQCLGLAAQAALAACVARGAFVGIASHADADACWADKVTPIVTEQQFPAWTGSPRYASAAADWQYPALDDRTHWNCPDCAYTMDGAVAKPVSIARVMRAYGLDPERAADRARVIFWDDEPANIGAVAATMPEVTAVLVARNGGSGSEGGCGITLADVAVGWAAHARGRR
ncbi:MAG: hypothetical protein R3B06_04370 [Kofleriaceae bacterium]